MADGRPPRAGSMDRKISLKWALLLLAVAIAAGLVAWGLQALRTRSVAQESDEALREQAVQTAQVTARSIATFGNRQIVQEDWGALQDAADELVSQRPLSYVAVVDQRGVAVVHTDRSLRGRRLPEPEEDGELAEASVPAMSATRQVATVRVGANIPQR